MPFSKILQLRGGLSAPLQVDFLQVSHISLPSAENDWSSAENDWFSRCKFFSFTHFPDFGPNRILKISATSCTKILILCNYLQRCKFFLSCLWAEVGASGTDQSTLRSLRHRSPSFTNLPSAPSTPTTADIAPYDAADTPVSPLTLASTRLYGRSAAPLP